MEWANVTKIHTIPLDEHALYKDNLRPGMVSYRKSSLASHSVMEIRYSCFMDTKYKCLTLGAIAIAVVFDTMCSELYVIYKSSLSIFPN